MPARKNIYFVNHGYSYKYKDVPSKPMSQYEAEAIKYRDKIGIEHPSDAEIKTKSPIKLSRLIFHYRQILGE